MLDPQVNLGRLIRLRCNSPGELGMALYVRPMSRDEVRRLDIEAVNSLSLPTSLLMENAGRGAAAWFAELVGAIAPSAGGRPFLSFLASQPDGVHRRPALPTVLILCGSGNNGGDGAVMARHLNSWGFSVRVIWFTQRSQLHGDLALQWTILENSKVDQFAWRDKYPSDTAADFSLLTAQLNDAEWLVDALLGTGLSRPVDGRLRSVIELMNHSGKPIFALDLPSGLDCDTGEPLGVAARATATATFVAPKIGFVRPGAFGYTGEVAVIDIGLPACLLAQYYER
jgi:NAD(P)H-hydrate epimerase